MSDPTARLPCPYDAGYDCGKNGANLTNCRFSLFARAEWTRQWELGKADADAGRPRRRRLED